MNNGFHDPPPSCARRATRSKVNAGRVFVKQAHGETSERAGGGTMTNMSIPSSKEAVKALLDGLSDLEVRQLCIKALRERHSRHPKEAQLSMHGGLGIELVPLLAARKGVQAGDVNSLKEPFLDSLNEPWMAGVVEFLNWFVRAGLAWPLGARTNAFPITLHLTRYGARFLGTPEDHPLLPGFVERVAARCPGLPGEVLSLLSDARECLDHGLMRPAIVLMGVAYEVAVENVVDALVTRKALPAVVADKNAAVRIREVNAAIDTVMPGSTPQERDDCFAAHAAYNFADALRRRRNDASHTTPTYGFEDREEVEELVVSAGRHLPNLWRVR